MIFLMLSEHCYAGYIILYTTCDQVSFLWAQLRLASELGSDHSVTVGSDRESFFNFNAGKTHFVSYYHSNNSSAINVKMDTSILVEKSLHKALGLTFSSQLNLGSHIVFITGTTSMKI